MLVESAEEFDCIEDLERDRAESEVRRLRDEIADQLSRLDGLAPDCRPEDDESQPDLELPGLTEGQVRGLLEARRLWSRRTGRHSTIAPTTGDGNR